MEIKDGDCLVADGLHPVGHCEECRIIQTKLYFIDNKGYCISCFPMVVNLKTAINKLKNK